MMISVEIFREGAWKESSRADVSVAVNGDGEITVTLPVGHLQPPWRVMRDGAVVFERQA